MNAAKANAPIAKSSVHPALIPQAVFSPPNIFVLLEAMTGIEPVIKVLQTHALPFCYIAQSNSLCFRTLLTDLLGIDRLLLRQSLQHLQCTPPLPTRLSKVFR